MKLPILLKSLHESEFKDFQKFLQSPFFKTSDQYLKYFKHLCEHHPTFELEKADLQAAYRSCFGPDSLNETKLYNLMSGMSKQIEQFLVVKLLVNNEKDSTDLFDLLLVKALGNRNMGPYFRKEAHRLVEDLQRQPVLSMDDYHRLNRLYHEIYFNPDTTKDEENPPYLEQAMTQLDLFYFTTKLNYVAEMKTREGIYQTQYDTSFLETLLAQSASPELLKTQPVLALYHHLVSLYHEGINEVSFRHLLDLFIRNFPNLKKVDQITLLTHLINCGSSIMRQGIMVDAELLSLYKLAMDSKALLVGNRITNVRFINIFNLACRRNEVDWAKKFMFEYKQYLEENTRQPILDMANAMLFYTQGLLDEAQTALKPEIYQISLLDIMGRTLLVKIAFDRFILYGKDHEFLEDQISAYERYLQNQALARDKIMPELNWIRFVRKMVSVKLGVFKVSEGEKAALRAKLTPLQSISIKPWLMERIDQL